MSRRIKPCHKQPSFLVGRYVTSEDLDLWMDDRPDADDCQHMTTTWGLFTGADINLTMGAMVNDFEREVIDQLTEPNVKVRVLSRDIGHDEKPEVGCVASGRVETVFLVFEGGEDHQHAVSMFWTVVKV